VGNVFGQGVFFPPPEPVPVHPKGAFFKKNPGGRVFPPPPSPEITPVTKILGILQLHISFFLTSTLTVVTRDSCVK